MPPACVRWLPECCSVLSKETTDDRLGYAQSGLRTGQAMHRSGHARERNHEFEHTGHDRAVEI